MRLHPAAPALLLMLAASGCSFDRVHQAHTSADLVAMERAVQNHQALPPLSSEPGRYGDYKPLMTYLHDGYARLIALNTEIIQLTGEVDEALKPASLLSAPFRKAKHDQLKRLIADLGDVADTQERLVGAPSEKVYLAMPGDETFKRNLIKGMSQRRDQVAQIRDLLTMKQAYYRQVDDIISLADEGASSVTLDGKVAFHTHAQQAAYEQRIHAFVDFEKRMNEKIKALKVGA